MMIDRRPGPKGPQRLVAVAEGHGERTKEVRGPKGRHFGRRSLKDIPRVIRYLKLLQHLDQLLLI